MTAPRDDTQPPRWPVVHPDRLQLYAFPTPNGQKAGIMLEELGLAYEAHRVDITSGEQFDEGFKRISPNSKIPALVDPDGPGNAPVAIMESGAILLYLAAKTGQLGGRDERTRIEVLQWLFFQMASVGPMFGQFGHFFKFARDKTQDDYALARYTQEAKRLLGVLETRLDGRSYLAGDEYTIADIATVPWVLALDFYGGKPALTYDELRNVPAWVERCSGRPAFVRGLGICRG